MPHSAAPLHQLHLFLVDTEYGTIGIGVAIETDDKTVAQGCHLVVVAYTCHRATGGYHISEMVEQGKYLFGCHRIAVLIFDACHLIGYTPVHLFWRLLENVSEAILHGVFVNPHTGCKFVAGEVLQRGLVSLIVSISF